MTGDLILRPASMDDAPLLLKWRNDPETRRHSHNSAPISEPDHLRWLSRSLEHATRKLWIATVNGLPIGTIRLDRDGPYHELSWTVAPEFRGQGWAKRMVTQTVQNAVLPVRAEVRIGNVGSGKVARASGMVFWKQTGLVTHFRKV